MRLFLVVLVLLSTLTLGACEVAGDIFKAGVGVGVLAVILVVAGIAFLATKMRS
jgi:hypothetical protein